MKHLVLLCLLSTGISIASENNTVHTDNQWYRQGQEKIKALQAQADFPKQAKNIIFFVGDGMSLATITASRIYQGQQKGEDGEENLLSFEKFPYTALSKTYNTNLQTPDSAGTMSAMITGIKTKAGAISVDERVQIGECGPKAHHTTSLLTEAELAGFRTGIVTTARLTHATPAATYANSEKRGWEADSDIPKKYRKDCKDIALQLIDYPHGDGLEVAMGGGRKNFIGTKKADPEYLLLAKGERKDQRDLTSQWLKKHDHAAYVWNQKQFDALDVSKTDHLLGLFEPSHMQYEIDRKNDVAGEPALKEMTAKALQILQKDDKPFFLMVEGGRIDHGHHAGYAKKALHDTVAFSSAIENALSMVDLNETLIMVTADHAHTMSMSGYAQKGNPILGKIVVPDDQGNPSKTLQKDAQGKPMTTLSYANGPGYVNGDERPDLTHVDTEHKEYKQAATVPLYSETHSGEDVIIYATGAGSQLVRGVLEQNMTYHIMKAAISHQLQLNANETKGK
ncbi:alkaline phosphatase [Marinicella rhabdoformis]|uniref:alkaline phosphatase n=1 Tax=Marinicella rhabdoformis TaxID=2580566 RepID=UPI0015D022A0|nr:alkaline phosphatase [Marinicella rhabdoformis]